MRRSFCFATLRAWLIAATVLGLSPGLKGDAAESPADFRVLIIGVDAIPYEVAARAASRSMGEQAIFKHMNAPVAVINSFPSNSHVAWTGLLEPFGIAKPAGYEPRYFHVTAGEMRAGLSLAETVAPWERFFDWRLEGVVPTAVAYGWPKHYSLQEIRKGLDAFVASNKRFFSMYIVSTDAVGHLFGPDALADVLRQLDAELQALRRTHPQLRFRTVIFSDHGMAGGEPLANIWPQVRSALEQSGFRTTEKIGGRGEVAIVAYGLLTSFVAHTAPGDAARVAEAISGVRGVDLCAARGEDGWIITSARGNARVQRSHRAGRIRWSYRMVSGDPLGYRGVVASLEQRAGADVSGWFPDDWWFDATKGEVYPDALYRIARGFDLVQNPASLICSVSPGFMFGALYTEYIAKASVGSLRWTHGALHRDASLGFLVTDLADFPKYDAVRFNEALAPLARLMERAPALQSARRE